jgi:hypothetical protein
MTGDGGGHVLIMSQSSQKRVGFYLKMMVVTSAILGVVTVRFEADTMHYSTVKVDQSDLSPADKQKLQSVLQELPAENIKHLSAKIVDMGWDSLGSLMGLIQSSVFSSILNFK